MLIVQLLAILSLVQLAQARLVRDQHDEPSGVKSKVKANFCSDPVQKGEVRFPDSIAGRAKINYKMYSGYVNVSSAPDFLFYWFFESQSSPSTDPLVIWTNGGPGCTAMEGATTEHGPLSLFMMKESCSNAGASSKCDYTQQLSSNPYAWNHKANVLYVDQPKNVGYSFGYGEETKSSKQAGEDIVVFYNNWLTLFPEFKGRKVVIGGESYGGHYVPAWSSAMLDFNAKNPADAIPLKGIVIGNGCVNNTVQNTATFVDFLHAESLIPATSSPKTQATAETLMISTLGYTPNYYDYRLEAVNCPACYSYNYTAWSLWFLKDDVLKALNICGDAGVDAFAGSAGGCISLPGFDSKDTFDYSAALGRALDGNVKVSLFYGQTDTACNYKGGLAMASTVPFSQTLAFNAAPLADWELVKGAEAGQVKRAGGLAFYQVKGAGHMVPMDQPAAAYAVLNDLLEQI